jgi:hypothetical protein
MRYIVNILIILALIIPFCLPVPVEATTTTLTITGDSGYVLGIVTGGWNNLNSNDGDGTTVDFTRFYLDDSGYNEKAWTASAYASGGTVNSVTVYYKIQAKGGGGSSVKPFVRIAGVNYYGTVNGAPFAVYNTYSYTWNTNPATGASWTSAAVNSAYYGLQGQTYILTSSYPVCTYAYISIDYTLQPPSVDTDAADTPTYSGGSHNCTLNGDVTEDSALDITERGFAYGTTSNSTTPGNEPPPASYTSNWTEGSADFGEGVFSHNIGGLVAGTVYYYRAFALNAQGYGWGDQKSFTTLTNPSITTVAATLVTTTTARLNSLLVSDGNQASDVRFSYGVASHSGNCTAGGTGTACGGSAYNTTTAWVSDTYVTGNTPYVDITGLTLGTTYYFCAQAQNDVSCTCGGELSFTTATGVNEPTSLQGVAGETTVSLLWKKGTGSTGTLIMRKTGGYPTSKTDGTEVYEDVRTSHKDTGLTSGTTYYYMAWGYSGAYYSTSNTTLMVTTLASGTAGEDLPVPATPDTWFQSPDYTNMENFPFYSIINFAFDAFEMPKSIGWYMLALIFAVACGVFFYSALGNSNLFLSIIVVGGVIVFESMLKLVPLWNILPFAIIALAGIFVGERRG